MTDTKGEAAADAIRALANIRPQVVHEVEVVRAKGNLGSGLLVAVCSCGEYESKPGHKKRVLRAWTDHYKAKADPDNPDDDDPNIQHTVWPRSHEMP